MYLLNIRMDSLRKYAFLFLTALTILKFDIAEAQVYPTKGKPSIGKSFSTDCKYFLNDGISFYSLPFRLSGEEWIYTLAGVGLIAVMMPLDDDVKKAVVGDGNNANDKALNIARDYGDLKYTGTASLVLYATGLFAKQKELRITGRMLLQSILYSGILTSGMKFITGRSRPYTTDNQFQFNWFEFNNDLVSIPSGHATVAFAVSTVLAERIDSWWARIGFYSLAAATAYSRIYDNQHWLTDVVLGSAIGFGAGYFTVHSETDRDKKKSKISDKIDFNVSLRGIKLAYKF